jgi:hypothetical protein
MPAHDNAKRRNQSDSSNIPPQAPPHDDRPEHRRFWYSASGAETSSTSTPKTKPQQPVDPNEVRR